MIKDTSQTYAQVVTLDLCLPTMAAPHPSFPYLPSSSRKKPRRQPWLFLSLLSSHPSPVDSISKGIWICPLSPCSLQRSSFSAHHICLHSHDSLPVLPLPLYCPHCCLYDLLNLNWYNVTPLLKNPSKDGISISDRDEITRPRFILPYEITKKWYKIYGTSIFKILDARQQRRVIAVRQEAK